MLCSTGSLSSKYCNKSAILVSLQSLFAYVCNLVGKQPTDFIIRATIKYFKDKLSHKFGGNRALSEMILKSSLVDVSAN